MARRIKIEFKRRRKGKTDYKARAALLRSGMPRLVVRKTNKYIITQIVESKEAQDYVVCTANSAELKNFGWTNSFKNKAAAYLTGILIAKKAKEKKINKAIPDLGPYRSTKGSKIYAALKGAVEGDLIIKFKTEMAPSKELMLRGVTRPIKSEHLKEIKEKIKGK